jgi:hypothetical protein
MHRYILLYSCIWCVVCIEIEKNYIFMKREKDLNGNIDIFFGYCNEHKKKCDEFK